MKVFLKKWAVHIFFVLILVDIIFFLNQTIKDRGIFEYFGVDYRLWYSTGNIIRYKGIGSIYNFDLQGFFQKQVFDTYSIRSNQSMEFWPLPLPYLSIFALPMIVLSYVKPLDGFLIWTILHILISVLYLLLFIRRLHLNIRMYYLVIIFISLPFFLNFLFAQVNLLLLIATGEFIVNYKKGKEEIAGICLAGLLLKPQNLLLVIPGLIYLRKWKILKGLTLAGLLILLVSLLLVGHDGILGLINTILNWPSQLGDSGMNLLAFSTNLDKVVPQFISKIIIICFYILLLFNIGKNWVDYKNGKNPFDFIALLFCTFLITFAISPHANIYMAMLIIPFGLVLFSNQWLSSKLSFYWLFVPITLFLITSWISPGLAHAVAGMAMLFVNILLASQMSNTKQGASLINDNYR